MDLACYHPTVIKVFEELVNKARERKKRARKERKTTKTFSGGALWGRSRNFEEGREGISKEGQIQEVLKLANQTK